MGDAFRPFQDHAQRLDRLLGVTLRQIEPANQKPLLTPLRRRLRLGLAQQAVGRGEIAPLHHQVRDPQTDAVAPFRIALQREKPSHRLVPATDGLHGLRRSESRFGPQRPPGLGRHLLVKRQRFRPAFQRRQSLRMGEDRFQVVR